MNKLEMNLDPISLFERECIEETKRQSKDKKFKQLSNGWLNQSWKNKYTYHFKWLGRPIIQMPQDIIAVQEIIWDTKPDLIIETGIAHGGSICLSASLLALLELEDLRKNDTSYNNIKERKVLGIDIDIRKHNKDKIKNHFLADKIEMIEGSSIDLKIFEKVRKLSQNFSNILLMLDSNHTEEHVLKELELYSPLVSKNSYCIVFDTVVANMDSEFSDNKPWNRTNSPKSAVKKFLKANKSFKVDRIIDQKLLISMAPGGFLKKIK